MSTIAITGATGALGTHVVEALLDRGIAAGDIVALARNTMKAAPLAEKGVTVRAFDYDAPDASALAGVDRLLLISGNEFGKRVAQHTAVIDAAKEAGVALVAYTSVDSPAEPLSSSTNPVAPEHAGTEEYLAASGVDHVLLRNGWYNENYLGELQTAAQSGGVLSSAGDGTVASASRRDYAEAAAAVLTADAPKPLYRLAGDVASSTADRAAALTEVLGRPISVNQVTPEQQNEILTGAGLDAGTAGFAVAVDQAVARGELAGSGNDLSTLIGRPTTPLIDTLRAAV
ncbi:MAG: SDR family oxidoreductase [Nakamurella sp.]